MAPIPPSRPGNVQGSGRRADSISAECALAWRHNLLASAPGRALKGARNPSPGRVIIGCGRPPRTDVRQAPLVHRLAFGMTLLLLVDSAHAPEVRIWKVPDTADLARSRRHCSRHYLPCWIGSREFTRTRRHHFVAKAASMRSRAAKTSSHVTSMCIGLPAHTRIESGPRSAGSWVS